MLSKKSGELDPRTVSRPPCDPGKSAGGFATLPLRNPPHPLGGGRKAAPSFCSLSDTKRSGQEQPKRTPGYTRNQTALPAELLRLGKSLYLFGPRHRYHGRHHARHQRLLVIADIAGYTEGADPLIGSAFLTRSERPSGGSRGEITTFHCPTGGAGSAATPAGAWRASAHSLTCT